MDAEEHAEATHAEEHAEGKAVVEENEVKPPKAAAPPSLDDTTPLRIKALVYTIRYDATGLVEERVRRRSIRTLDEHATDIRRTKAEAEKRRKAREKARAHWFESAWGIVIARVKAARDEDERLRIEHQAAANLAELRTWFGVEAHALAAAHMDVLMSTDEARGGLGVRSIADLRLLTEGDLIKIELDEEEMSALLEVFQSTASSAAKGGISEGEEDAEP